MMFGVVNGAEEANKFLLDHLHWFGDRQPHDSD